MGAMLEVVTGRLLGPFAAFTALAPNTGDTFAVRDFNPPSQAFLIEAWASAASAGQARIHSPRMHDNSQGIRARWQAAQSSPLLPNVIQQPLYPNDVLVVEALDNVAEEQNVSMLMYYQDLPGSAARLFDWPTIDPRIRNILTVEVAVVSGAVLGDYSGAVTIASLTDLLKGGCDYAILGYDTDVACHTIGIRGPDTGNFRLGGPGTSQRIDTRGWFVRTSEDNGLPLIPVINSQNKGGTFIDIVAATAALTVNVDLVLAELAS